jgi:catechol 2,3-dioxygenase-like lactoylglutathione lyase family enzyme
MPDELVNVRYMVDDVERAVAFYTTHFGSEVRTSAAPAFADVVRSHLRVLLSGPKSSAGRPMPDGRVPFRNEIISGPGGRQILLEDPAGNPIELFQPAGS